MADDTWCSPWLKPLTHTNGQHTSHSATRSGACHGVHQPCHSYTPKEEDHGLMAKVASTTCHHYERESERLDGGQWTCECGQATCNTTGQKEAPLKPCSHHSSLHQQPPHHHTHHTSVVMVTHCLLTHTHTHEGQGRTRNTPPPSQWCGWLAQ